MSAASKEFRSSMPVIKLKSGEVLYCDVAGSGVHYTKNNQFEIFAKRLDLDRGALNKEETPVIEGSGDTIIVKQNNEYRRNYKEGKKLVPVKNEARVIKPEPSEVGGTKKWERINDAFKEKYGPNKYSQNR